MQYVEKCPTRVDFLTTSGSVDCRLFRASGAFTRPPAVFDLMECFSQIKPPPPPVLKVVYAPDSTLKSSSFMFCQTFTWNFIHASCHSYFLMGNVTQNVYSGEFSNVNNEFNVRNVRNCENFLSYFPVNCFCSLPQVTNHFHLIY